MRAPADELERILTPLTLAFIFVVTGIGVVVGVVSDSGGSSGYLIAMALVVAAIADILIIRWLVLPSQAAKPEVPRQILVRIGYAAADTGAVFAPAAAIISGSPWVALLLGAISLLSWVVIWSYLQDLPERPLPSGLDEGELN